MYNVENLTTERLELKKITIKDLNDYIEWKSQHAYHEYLPSNPKSKEEYEESINSIIEGYETKKILI